MQINIRRTLIFYQAFLPNRSGFLCTPCNWATPWSFLEERCAGFSPFRYSVRTWQSISSSFGNICFCPKATLCTTQEPICSLQCSLAHPWNSSPLAVAILRSLSASPTDRNLSVPSLKNCYCFPPYFYSKLLQTYWSTSLSIIFLHFWYVRVVPSLDNYSAQLILTCCHLSV